MRARDPSLAEHAEIVVVAVVSRLRNAIIISSKERNAILMGRWKNKSLRVLNFRHMSLTTMLIAIKGSLSCRKYFLYIIIFFFKFKFNFLYVINKLIN